MLRIVSEPQAICLSIGDNFGDTDGLSASAAVNSSESLGRGGIHRNLEGWF